MQSSSVGPIGPIDLISIHLEDQIPPAARLSAEERLSVELLTNTQRKPLVLIFVQPLSYLFSHIATGTTSPTCASTHCDCAQRLQDTALNHMVSERLQSGGQERIKYVPNDTCSRMISCWNRIQGICSLIFNSTMHMAMETTVVVESCKTTQQNKKQSETK